MGKTAIVKFSEISDPVKNPTLCLSALRYTGGCGKCPVFKKAQYYYKTYWDTKTQKTISVKKKRTIDETIQNIACNPLISKEKMELLYKREELHKQIADIDKQIEEINEKMEK